MLWSAKESLIVSPGDSLTVVLGPGGFGKGGSEVWQPPHASTAKTSKAKGKKKGSTRVCDELCQCTAIVDRPTSVSCSASCNLVYSTKLLMCKIKCDEV